VDLIERVAREIEPAAWAHYDEMGGDNGRTRRDREWSLVRARAAIVAVAEYCDETIAWSDEWGPWLSAYAAQDCATRPAPAEPPAGSLGASPAQSQTESA
jgi:hypothetical protein